MIYRLIICILLLGQIQTYSQTIIRGLILDSMMHPIEYASVGIINKPIGTVTDKNGAFKLEVNKDLLSSDDSLRVSIIGFYSKSISLNKISDQADLSINLREKVEQLAEIVVIAPKVNEKTIGSKGLSLLNMYCQFATSENTNQNLGSEIGRKFSINHKNTLLKNFRFCLAHNNFDTVRFRINVYSLRNLKPNVNLLNQNIICEVANKKKGWIDVYLSQANIILNDDVVVSLEWIYKSRKGSALTMPIIMPTTHVHFYKFGSQNEWKRFNSMTTLMELTVN